MKIAKATAILVLGPLLGILLGLIVGAFAIPVEVGKPPAEIVRKIDFTFASHYPVWQERELAFEKPLDHVGHGATGVDPPDEALLLTELSDQGEKSSRYRRISGGVVQGAVEIKRQDCRRRE